MIMSCTRLPQGESGAPGVAGARRGSNPWHAAGAVVGVVAAEEDALGDPAYLGDL